MKQVLFILALIAYLIIGLVGLATHAYVDTASLNGAVSRLMVPLILFSLVIAAAFFYGFIKAFPKGFERQKTIGKIAIPIVFALLSFAINRGFVMIWNTSLGKQQTFYISGRVTDKWWERSRRSKRYYIAVQDTVTGKYYEFKTRKSIYDNFESYSEFSLKFTTGSLGIIYREER